jgi:hypothetical protein
MQSTKFELAINLKNRQDAWPHRAADDARDRRRGDRIGSLTSVVGTFRTYSTALTTSVRRGKADIATARCDLELALGPGGNNASKSASLQIAA